MDQLALEEYFKSLYDRLAEARLVMFREVNSPGWKPKQNECHKNAAFWIKGNTGRFAVKGWLTWGKDETGRCRLMAHTVVEENGELYDITPIDPNTPRPKFLKHIGTDQLFDTLASTHWTDVTYPPFTYQDLLNSHSVGEIEYE